ncbi:MAG TPA: helix-turn-helix transcriptional regulator [Amycolatopsis sp.]|uniref:helix-turn-helix domain-containing protein n=1 Tax=Amycolatopsis sp. TaxID=37632 RepID=UPI002B481248|nr:helix-turn-helix transcriptional regulator [Amycolatopsis sp.]HKS44893.1 helix-turn-helix transcriptional regulator [Amycolatopsis sp.]
MVSPGESRLALARRLKALREEHWPDRGITQLQLAQAFGGRKPLSVSLISSWESLVQPVVPPVNRLSAYATFFATERSVGQESYRVLPVSQLSSEELARREELLRELRGLRSGALQEADPVTSLWHFPDLHTVTIVCAQLPVELRMDHSYTDRDSPDYVELYTYADLDALIELYGHIRAFNPPIQVNFRTAQDLMPDDYTTHLVLLGGVDWNVVTKDLLDRVELPVSQVARAEKSDIGGFEVFPDSGKPELFTPRLDRNGYLIEDVAHFYRDRNPYNLKRTVTICNGMFGRGTLGAVRALTDARFRDRNTGYIRRRFGNAEAFSVLTRISVVRGQVLTPDWTLPESVLHEWSRQHG